VDSVSDYPKKVTDQNAALFTMFFYVSLALAIVVSLSFQPDPFMIVGLLVLQWQFQLMVSETTSVPAVGPDIAKNA
jgi:hypothetical protein